MAAASLLVLSFAEPANARPETGPSSSASISISVSVAPRFGLRATEAPGSLEAGNAKSRLFCIDSNEKPLTLPILLARTHEAVQAAPDRERLPSCGNLGNSGDVPVRGGTQTVIVYPE